MRADGFRTPSHGRVTSARRLCPSTTHDAVLGVLEVCVPELASPAGLLSQFSLSFFPSHSCNFQPANRCILCSMSYANRGTDLRFHSSCNQSALRASFALTQTSGVPREKTGVERGLQETVQNNMTFMLAACLRSFSVPPPPHHRRKVCVPELASPAGLLSQFSQSFFPSHSCNFQPANRCILCSMSYANRGTDLRFHSSCNQSALRASFALTQTSGVPREKTGVERGLQETVQNNMFLPLNEA